MSDNTQVTAGAGDFIRDIDKAGVKTQVIAIDIGGAGTESLLSSTSPMPVSVTGSVAVTGGLTDTQLRASEVPVSLTAASSVSVSNFPASYPVSAGFAAPVAVRLSDGTTWLSTLGVSMNQLPTALVSGRLDVNVGALTTTSTQPVSGTFWQTTQPVSIATVVAVNDNAGSLTVDAPVGTPVFVRLSDGTSALSTLGVSMTQLPSALVNSRLDVNVGAATTSSTLPVSMAQLPAALVSSRLDVNVGAVTTTSTQPVSGTFWQTTQPVSIGTTVTVAAPVAAPVFVRLSDGAAAIATLPVSITTASSMSVICSTANTLSVAVSTAGVVAVGGNISTGTAEAGNPVKIGAAVVIAKGALPAGTANASRVALTADAYGRLVDRKSDIWSKTHDPGPAVQATCNSSAQASGVRNVCTSVAMSLVTTAAPTAVAAVTFTLYDGTTAGTVLWSMRAVYPAAAAGNWNFGLSDLWIEGTAATQMTFSIAAATTTNVAASVAMTGTISQ